MGIAGWRSVKRKQHAARVYSSEFRRFDCRAWLSYRCELCSVRKLFGVGSARGRNPTFSVEVLRYGIGIHLGDVKYGKIGSRTRLDFTVIRRAVNVAARLGALTKQLGRQVLVSSDFVAAVPSISFDGLGAYELKRLETPVDVYTPRTG
nr:adenylate/guanylate cyclase domain-containing protein [Agrobacterium pusense]